MNYFDENISPLGTPYEEPTIPVNEAWHKMNELLNVKSAHPIERPATSWLQFGMILLAASIIIGMLNVKLNFTSDPNIIINKSVSLTDQVSKYDRDLNDNEPDKKAGYDPILRLSGSGISNKVALNKNKKIEMKKEGDSSGSYSNEHPRRSTTNLIISNETTSLKESFSSQKKLRGNKNFIKGSLISKLYNSKNVVHSDALINDLRRKGRSNRLMHISHPFENRGVANAIGKVHKRKFFEEKQLLDQVALTDSLTSFVIQNNNLSLARFDQPQQLDSFKKIYLSDSIQQKYTAQNRKASIKLKLRGINGGLQVGLPLTGYLPSFADNYNGSNNFITLLYPQLYLNYNLTHHSSISILFNPYAQQFFNNALLKSNRNVLQPDSSYIDTYLYLNKTRGISLTESYSFNFSKWSVSIGINETVQNAALLNNNVVKSFQATSITKDSTFSVKKGNTDFSYISKNLYLFQPDINYQAGRCKIGATFLIPITSISSIKSIHLLNGIIYLRYLFKK